MPVHDLLSNHVEDDISILSTPYVPDIEEARAIQSRLQIRGEKIRALDLTIQNLCAQRDTLRRATSVAQTLLAPIRKLPPETLAEVFVLCMPVVYDPDVRDFPSKRHRANPAAIRQCLREVCRRWRDILEDTPRAWAALVFDSSLPDDLSIMHRLLRKSKSCPLDIFIDPSAWASRNTDPGQAHIRTILQILRGEVKRFRRFYGDVKYTDGFEFLRELFPCDERSNAPVMEAFGIRTLSKDGNMGTIMAPKLQSIDLRGTITPLGSFITTSFPSMRQLRLKISGRSVGVASYLSSLVYFPQLEVLDLDGLGVFRENALEPYQLGIKMPLSALKNLSLTSFTVIDAEELLQSLHIPCLDTLHLSLRGYNIFVTRVFSHCLAQVGITLRHLNLNDVRMTGDDTQWLSNLVNVRSLSIHGRFVDEAFVSALIPSPSTPFETWVCPRLETLIFNSVILPGADFLRLVRDRTQPDGEEPRSGYLNCLKASYCSGLEDVYVELEQMNRPSFQLQHPIHEASG